MDLKILSGSRVRWEGTLPATGGHLSDTFPGTMFFKAGVTAKVVDGSTAPYRFFVYGRGFGVNPGMRATHR